MSDLLTFQDEAEAQRVCERWQKILRLQDWRIVVQIKRSRDVAYDEACGLIHHFDEQVGAKMVFPRRGDIEPGVFGDDDDQEATMVHEMLHIFTALRSGNSDDNGKEVISASSIKIEQTINKISWALIALDRQARGCADLSFYRQVSDV